MWGNRLGWTISAVLCLVVAGLAYGLVTLAQPTPPAGDLVAAADVPLTLPAAARPLLPAAKPLGDAADLYRKSIADYHDHQTAYDDLAASRDYDQAAVAQLKGFDDWVDAAALPTMDLFRSHPETIVNYDQSIPTLADLQSMAKGLQNVVALATLAKDYATARKYAGATLALGDHLYRERLTYDELMAGLSLMGDGSAGIKQAASAAGDQPAVEAATAFDKARLAEYEQVKKVWKILSSLDDENIGRHAGDFFQLAGDAKADPVWRTEAVRRLGRLQLYATRAPDNARARAVLKKMAADPSLDPVLHQAAVAARDITLGENQSQR